MTLPQTTYLAAGYGECRLFDGKRGHYQDAAARVLYERGANVLPHMWVTPSCGTDNCVEHLRVNQPQTISYPAGVCVYCGLIANTRDHLIPQTWSGAALRRFVATVPACSECNCSAISDKHAYRISERRDIAHAYIAKKYASALRTKPHTAQELAELGPSLRAYVKHALGRKEITRARLAWPEDPDYDLRAFQHSGIEDPYLLGLI